MRRVRSLAEYVGGSHPRPLRDTDPWIRSDADHPIVVEQHISPELGFVRLEWRAGETLQIPLELSHGLIPRGGGRTESDGHANGKLRIVDRPEVEAVPAPKVGARRGSGSSGAPASPAT